MKKFFSTLFLLFVISTNAQSNFKRFLKASCPIKTWILFHPFKAKKAFIISNEAKRVTDSIAKTDLLDKDISSGQIDAFRHAFWMATLHQKIGRNAARSLGKAHEKDNYKTYKKRRLEDGVVPDEISSEMDLHNNKEGLKLSSKGSIIPKKELVYKIVNAIKAGKMKIIKKNAKGNFLTCNGRIILQEELKGKWENNKCLVPSNQLIE